RHGDGAAGRRRPGGPGRRLAHPQGVPPPRTRRPARPAGGGPAVRAGPLRPEDRRGLVPLPRGQPGSGRRPPGAASHRGGRARRGHRAPDDRARGNRRADGLRLRQRRGTHPRRGHRPPRRGYRHRLRPRLRLPGLSRRADVVRGHGGPETGLRPRPALRAAARRPVDARAASQATRRVRQDVRRPGQGKWLVMSDLDRAYRSRLVTHEELVGRMKPGDVLSLGTWMGQPHGVMRALVRHGRHLDPLYVFCAPASDVGDLLQMPNVHCVSSFLGPAERAAQRDRGSVSYIPTQYTDYQKFVRTTRFADFYLVRAAPMDQPGFFTLSRRASWRGGAPRWLPRNAPAARIVVEVNRHLPRVRGLPQFGGHEIPVEDVDFIVEDHTPLPDYLTPEATATDRAIAANVAALVEDRATIQFGIGSIPMSVRKLLNR